MYSYCKRLFLMQKYYIYTHIMRFRRRYYDVAYYELFKKSYLYKTIILFELFIFLKRLT